MDTVRSSDGTQIAFDRVGEGPALVYVGGALNDRLSGAPLATLLAGDFTVYNYDRRGRGSSGDTPPYSVDKEIDDLRAVIEAAGGTAAVYGISSGAVLGLRAAACGVPITRLAMYEPPFRPNDDATRRADEEYDTKLTELLAAGRRGDALELFMTKVGMPGEMITQVRRSPMWAGLEALVPTLPYDEAVMDAGEPTTTVPVLVLGGGASPAWLRDAAVQLAERLPRSQLRTLPDQTHDVAPEALAPVLADFLLAG